MFLLSYKSGALRISPQDTNDVEIYLDLKELEDRKGIERVRQLVLDAAPELNDFDTKVELLRSLREIGAGAEMAGPLAVATREAMDAISADAGNTNATGDSATRNCVTVTAKYPSEILPRTLREFAEGYSRAMGVPVELLGMPALVMCAAAIGNTHRVRINQSWTEANVLWTVPLLESGDLKTPSFKAVTRPFNIQQSRAEKLYQKQLEEYDAAKVEYEAKLAVWKREKSTEEQPLKPLTPTPVDFFTADSTVESMAMLQAANPRGVCLLRDELSAWLGSFGQYKSGRGGDEGAWLELYTGGTLKVNRVSKRVFVPSANASIIGTCQPAVFARLVQGDRGGDGGQVENGMIARFMAFQPVMGVKVWTDGRLPADVAEKYAAMVDSLLLMPMQVDEEGQPVTRDIPLSPGAQRDFAVFVNQHGLEKSKIEDPALRYHYSKLEGIAARLAMVIHLCRGIDGEVEDFDCIDQQSVKAGITLVGWLKAEAHKLYSRFSESPTQKTQRELVDLVQRNGGSITARELTHASRKYRESGTADAALEDLVAGGAGVWNYDDQEGRGRPVKRFSLSGNGNKNTAGTLENANCVTGGVR